MPYVQHCQLGLPTRDYFIFHSDRLAGKGPGSSVEFCSVGKMERISYSSQKIFALKAPNTEGLAG